MTSNSSTSLSSSVEGTETATGTAAAAAAEVEEGNNNGEGSSSEILAETLKQPHYNNQKINRNNNNNNDKISRNTSSIRSEPVAKYEMSERLQSMMRTKEARSLSASNVNRMAENTVLPKTPGRGGSGGGRPKLPAGRVSVREMNYGIPALADMGDHVDEVHGKESWRAHTINFIHQKWVQHTMLILLCLDVLIIFTELFLMSAFPVCSIVVRDAISCCPYDGGAGTDSDGDKDVGRWLAGGGSDYHEICEAGFEEYTGYPSCDGHKWHVVHTIEEVLFWCTITILSLFMIENTCEMIALTPCIYFKQFFLALDFFIITISLVLELVFHLAHKAGLEELAGLLVFIRLWRFVRIGHGLIEVTAELQHENYEDLCEYARECEKQLLANNVPLPEQTEHVKDLKVEDKMNQLLKQAESLDTIGE
eukprot:CAMPEP_0113452038 /NCGR_PEP_ID=MMETSP0014_2-20120614/6644_1 /TAXON_ID=2857 /ORGANISM="Nitzschia sp." /LENGTH=421 /DNA_ID=CAMNT_0000343405 /DNA_START=53 /DNA_END=1318 /DNA_ORIENTATION=+ /assembly_acc=CAM_ASM_000159